MKTTVLSIIFLAVAYAVSFAQVSVPAVNYTLPKTDNHYIRVKEWIEDTIDADYQHASVAAIEAFRDIKYGVRIHWGPYSILPFDRQWNTSWQLLDLSYEQKQAYQELYKTWNPTGFNAEEWMKLFSDNGLKMFAITTNHHDGFNMYNTKARIKKRANWIAPGGPALEDCDLAYSIMETPFHRDVIKELCDAGHKYGLKIDLYYSHPNWYNADYRPYVSDPLQIPDVKEHPELYGKARPGIYGIVPNPTPYEEARMMAYHRKQLTELLTNYGKIDMICLDMWLGKKVWPQMRQEMKDFRKIQPEVMFRARGIGNYGDYYTPEGFVPGSQANTDMPWFVIYPYGKYFSYNKNDDFKGVDWIIKNLTDIVAKGGNFMIGIGPDSTGRFDPRVIEAIKEAGAWLKINGEAIFATRPREGDLWKEGDVIRFTSTKDKQTIYAISLGWPGQLLKLKTVEPKQSSEIYLLGWTKPLEWKYNKVTGLEISLPAELQDDSKRPCKMAWSFRIAALN